MFDAKLWRHFDFWLLGAVLLLCIFGIAMIRSVTLSASPESELYGLTNRQIAFVLIGLGVVLLFSVIDYRFYDSVTHIIYAVLIVLLVIVFFVAQATFGAARWIDLGVINLQPSELGKFLIILTLGHYIVTHSEEIKNFSFIVKTMLHVGLPVLLIAVQPDISSCILYGVIWFALLWASGMRWSHILILAGVATVLGVIGFFVALQSERSQYVAFRVINFVLPDVTSEDYAGAAYNVNQALISIGAGGWTGEGYGQGTQVQLRFLKVRHTDYIFASIANEFGFAGAALVIAFFAFIVIRIFRAGQLARDPYGKLICYGIGVDILFEAFSNIAATMNLIPVTGSPLPFVSYGGSSLWTFLIAIGLVQSVILRQKQIEF
ncbi:MAG: FtsW/RodA/SpoVE family cell cycle protein [Anaerolineales bacterium]